MMKKRIAMIMAAAMITGVSATTAFAEGSSLDGAPQMGGPQIPGGNENGQAPSDNGQQAPQGEAPSDNGQQATQGEGPKDGFGFMPLEEYVKDGTISQETYDAITKYMDENKPELPRCCDIRLLVQKGCPFAGKSQIRRYFRVLRQRHGFPF